MSDDPDVPGRPLIGVGVVLFRGDLVLLVRRARPPLLGAWSFPGGRQELGETVEAAGRRELHEETGMTAGPLVLAGYADAIHRDPAGRIGFHYTILDLAGIAVGPGEPVATGDVSEARFVSIGGLGEWGVDDAHRGMVAVAVRRLKARGFAP